MKKLISVLVLVTVLFSAGALAEELQDRTDPFHFSAFKEAAYASDGAETVFTIVSGEGYAAGAEYHQDVIIQKRRPDRRTALVFIQPLCFRYFFRVYCIPGQNLV